MLPNKLIEPLPVFGQRRIGQNPRGPAWLTVSVKQQLSHQLDMSFPPLDATHLRENQGRKDASELGRLIARQRLVQKPSPIFIYSSETVLEYGLDQVLFGPEVIVHHRGVALPGSKPDLVEADGSDPPVGEHRLRDGDEFDTCRFSAAVAAVFARPFPNAFRLRGHRPIVRTHEKAYIMKSHYYW